MSLATIMLEQLVAARRVIRTATSWCRLGTSTAEGTFLIFTRFDNDKDA
jgi:hypothetical protein